MHLFQDRHMLKIEVGGLTLKSVAQALATNNALRRLDVGTNAIHKEGCEMISDALCINTSLTVSDRRFYILAMHS